MNSLELGLRKGQYDRQAPRVCKCPDSGFSRSTFRVRPTDWPRMLFGSDVAYASAESIHHPRHRTRLLIYID